MKRLLIIAIEFAPISTTGNYRSLKFVKYLKQFDVEPIVITLDRESGQKVFADRFDEQLLEDIPADIQIIRLPTSVVKDVIKNNKLLNFLRFYFNTDDKIAHKWKKTLFPKLKEVVDQYSPDAIYITLPPFSGHFIVKHLKKHFNIPIIVDMRDAWSHWTSSPWQTKLHYNKVYKREKRMFESADKIITVTPELGKIFEKSHPHATKEKIQIISNGFDWNEKFQERICLPTLKEQDKIVIGYIGAFYFNWESHSDKQKKWWKRSLRKMPYYSPVKEDWSYRSPLYFLKALHGLFKKYPKLKNRITFEHIGKTPNWMYEMLERYDLKENFISHGFVKYEEVLKLQKQFDYFLATSEKVENGNHYCLPSKLFDYLKAQKPIISFVTNGSQKHFLETCGISIFCDPDNIESSSKILYNTFTRGGERKINAEYIASFHRKKLTEQLAALI